MKYLTILFAVALIMSCSSSKTDQEKLISENNYLIGKWTGDGHFMNVNFAGEIGEVGIEFEIKNNFQISGKIGEAMLTNMSIEEAKYGFAIKGQLNSKIKKDNEFDKDHLIILLVLAKENRAEVNASKANFHLKDSYSFDLGMRVGGVELVKSSN